MMRIIFSIFFIFSITSLVSAQGIMGRVTSSEDSLAIEGVHIVNVTANNMAISDQNGKFNLIAEIGDTLIVSNINFNTKLFIVNNTEYLKIGLNPATIQLDEVRVSNLPETESEFKKKLVNMGMQDDNTFVPYGMKANKPQGKIPKNYDPSYTGSLGYAINKPFSFIVKKLSKSHKSKLKYYQIVANQGNTIGNNKKYNPVIVEELTGLKGDELINFIEFLDLDPAFVKRSSDYEIAERILSEFDHYKSQKSKG
jgi:hypothetical protein